MPKGRLALGIDIGTSGVRAIAIDPERVVVDQAAQPMPPAATQPDRGITQAPEVWWQAVEAVLREIAARQGHAIGAIAVDGTSGTLLLADRAGRPLGPGRLYNDASAAHLADAIALTAPPESAAHGATSPLARLLMMQARHPDARFALHQADWVAGRLAGRFGISDENNALKLGYDPVARRWPVWLARLGVEMTLLPRVLAPGAALGTLLAGWADELGLARDCRIVAGTTDGCASFLATGADQPGDGVTALGSTLTLKLLSDQPIFAPAFGIYSHRLGDAWLAGGASNTGGSSLLRFFTSEQIVALTARLRPDEPTGLDWHPLPGLGERFPVADPELRFEPTDRPADEVRFFQALLEGIAAVEGRAYAKLTELGGPPLRTVRTVGGGAGNPGWTQIRAARLGVPMPPPAHLEAAYGTALLALAGSVE